MGVTYKHPAFPSGKGSGVLITNETGIKRILRKIDNPPTDVAGKAFPQMSGYISAVRWYPFLLVSSAPDMINSCYYSSGTLPPVTPPPSPEEQAEASTTVKIASKVIFGPGDPLDCYYPKQGFLPRPLSWTIPDTEIENWLTLQGINNFIKYSGLKIELYVPFFGFMDINVSDLVLPSGQITGMKICVFPDLYTGKGVLAVYRGASTSVTDAAKPILISEAKLGLEIAFGINNGYEMTVNNLTNGMKTNAGVVSAGIGGMAAAAAGHPALAMAGLAIGGITAIMNGYINQLNNRPALTKGQTGDPVSNLQLPLGVFIRIYAPTRFTADLTTRYSLIGHAAGYTAKLGDLTGFTQVANIHLEGLDGATAPELAEIEDLLKKGVIL